MQFALGDIVMLSSEWVKDVNAEYHAEYRDSLFEVVDTNGDIIRVFCHISKHGFWHLGNLAFLSKYLFKL